MIRIQSKLACFWVFDSPILIDETLVGNDTADHRVCIAGIPMKANAFSEGAAMKERNTYIPATQAPSPQRYRRQNFLTACALVSVAKADTGGVSSVMAEFFSSMTMVEFLSSTMLPKEMVSRLLQTCGLSLWGWSVEGTRSNYSFSGLEPLS